jgi:outer membrane receptor for ferric coprogen and ferric-rhodotorulic acid
MNLPRAGKSLLCVLAIGIIRVAGNSDVASSAEPEKYNLKIESQSLDQALQEFARQSGLQIIYFSQVTQGLRAPPLAGQYTIDAAFDQLLHGSRLSFRVINPKTVEIRPADRNSPDAPRDRSATLPPDTPAPVSGQRVDSRKMRRSPDEIAEVVVNGTAEGLVATRTATPLREIPQTVSIISREQIRQQNDTDLADALNHAAGITAVRTDSLGQNLYSRGFQITAFHLDGGAAVNAFDDASVPFFGTPDLSEFDHIEVLRGSDSLFGGKGNPGAAISLVRKRPLATTELSFSALAGSWDRYRLEGDITGPLGFDGALRGRLDGVYASREFPRALHQ